LNGAKFYLWDEFYYALGVTERLELEESGGMVRVGPVPQNRWFTTRWRRFGTCSGIYNACISNLTLGRSAFLNKMRDNDIDGARILEQVKTE
jgi:hypothetical protein